MNLPDNLNLRDHWERFEHEVLNVQATALINNDWLVDTSVYIQMQHWIGAPNTKNISTHAFGWRTHIKDLWLLPDHGLTPYRTCNMENCGGVSAEQVREYEYKIKDLEHRLKLLQEDRDHLQDLIKKL